MSETADNLARLYQQTVLAHSRAPRNRRRLGDANREAEGHNLLCGDKLNLYLRVEDDCIADIGFEGSGCAISLASASMMTEAVKGRRTGDATEAVRNLLAWFGDGSGRDAPAGELAALSGVRDYPSRIRCATLPWQTLEAALAGRAGTVSTE